MIFKKGAESVLHPHPHFYIRPQGRDREILIFDQPFDPDEAGFPVRSTIDRRSVVVEPETMHEIEEGKLRIANWRNRVKKHKR